MVVEHGHHLGLLLPRRVFEEAGLVSPGVIDVGAGQGQVLQDEHSGLIRLPVEIRRQDAGHDSQRIDAGLLRSSDVVREFFRAQLVEAKRRRVAGATQEHRPSVHCQAPTPGADVPRELAKGEHVVDAR